MRVHKPKAERMGMAAQNVNFFHLLKAKWLEKNPMAVFPRPPCSVQRPPLTRINSPTRYIAHFFVFESLKSVI